jgi:hypothetical protein
MRHRQIRRTRVKKELIPMKLIEFDKKKMILLVIVCTYCLLTSLLNKSTSFVTNFTLREYRYLMTMYVMDTCFVIPIGRGCHFRNRNKNRILAFSFPFLSISFQNTFSLYEFFLNISTFNNFSL